MIYVLRGAMGLKIGTTKDIPSRLQQLRTGDPSLKLLIAFEGDHMTEAALHRRFAPDRIAGEYFNDSPGVLSELERIALLFEPPPLELDFYPPYD